MLESAQLMESTCREIQMPGAGTTKQQRLRLHRRYPGCLECCTTSAKIIWKNMLQTLFNI